MLISGLLLLRWGGGGASAGPHARSQPGTAGRGAALSATQRENDNRANQLNPNNKAYRGDDNKANQLNPNNDKYWKSRNLGLEIWSCLDSDPNEQSIDDSWRNDVRCAAIGADSYFLTWPGGCKHRNVPAKLAAVVAGKPNSQPTYVALGCDNQRYFVLFDDGSAQWVGPDDLTASIRASFKDGANVSRMAFAPDNGYFVLFADGDYTWKGLPTSMHNFMHSNLARVPYVDHVSVGENGDWFVSFLDGKAPRWRSSKSNSEAKKRMDSINAGTKLTVRSIEYGAGDSSLAGNWLIRYDKLA
ncbi:hypothetical protein M885DRAFT_524706 [Pelagophyceae sp. CCMP2097]|nr:hypothetical protein M885DRAFT_524706 [Pelagophyceae sp. CCMP2097]